MTRKEPKFIDDLTRVDLTVGDLDSTNDGAIKQAAVSSERSVAVKSNSNSNWLLWLFVTVSLCVSFGMAFFGLEEAGRYQAALEKTEAQAQQLEETLERLNRLQTQGIGELAQSDAQMRKMVSSVENKIVNEVTEQLALTSKRMEALSSDVAKTKLDFSALQTDLQSVIENQDSLKENLSLAQNQMMSERARLDQSNKDVASLYEQLGTIDKLTGQLITQLSEVNARVDLAQSAASKALDDKTAVLATEILSEEVLNNRLKIQDSENRINRQDQINQLVSAEAKKLKDRVIALNEMEPQLDEMTRLVEELDAGRRQLTQRIIDLDSRWNEISRLQGSLATTQRQIEKVENSLKQNTDELNRLGSRLDEELKLGSAQ